MQYTLDKLWKILKTITKQHNINVELYISLPITLTYDLSIYNYQQYSNKTKGWGCVQRERFQKDVVN